MSFRELFSNLNTVKDMFPSMRWTPTLNTYGESVITITIPVTNENAQLLLDAQAMFAPRDEW